MVCAVSNNLVTGDIEVGQHNQRLAVGWDETITVVLETIHQLGI
jgi:hypothetical protein